MTKLHTKRSEARENTKGFLQAMLVLAVFTFEGFIAGVVVWLAIAYIHKETILHREEKHGEIHSTIAFFMSSFLLALMFIGGFAS